MNLNDNRLIIKTLRSGDQKVLVLIYISTLERLESGNPRTSLFYLFNESQNRMEPF